VADPHIAITFDRDSIVNERTGNVSGPSEYVENLRALERSITRGDEDIESLKARLKMAREIREEAVAALRSAIREGKVLPLLEAVDPEADGDAPPAPVVEP
jgi:hypothetical protein